MIYLVLGLAIGALIGYVIGISRRGIAAPVNLSDPEEAEAFSNKGHKAINERIQKRKDRIVEKARELGAITNDGVEDLFCIGDNTASRYLSQLVTEGRLERYGSGRGTHYTVPKT